MYDLSRELTVILISFWWLQKVWEGLAVSKQAAQKFDVERFNLRKLSELEVRKWYQNKISNRFAALENLNDGEDIKRGC
jgi:ferredoxin-fold anticodon binding domain-containing protein